MNGDFDITVEKMVRSHVASTLGTGTPSIHCVHRLDFATSGILCVALNKKAAQVASKVFELRLASKKYTALVYAISTSTMPHRPKYAKISLHYHSLWLSVAGRCRHVEQCSGSMAITAA